MAMLERKIAPLIDVRFKAPDGGPGSFSGYGAVFNNVDDGGDLIKPGAFRDALPAFRERGFIPVGHDWRGLPVATVKEASEDTRGLLLTAEFHSTQAAQDARTVIRERVARRKFIGLSIGFLPDYANGGVETREDGVRVIKRIKELAEVSIVTVPMNREAGVVGVKHGTRTVGAEVRRIRYHAALALYRTHLADMYAKGIAHEPITPANWKRRSKEMDRMFIRHEMEMLNHSENGNHR